MKHFSTKRMASLLLLSLLAVSAVFAAPRTVEQAKQIAQQQMSKNAAKKVKGQGSVAAVNPQLVFSKMGQNANAYYYVFNAGQNLGFTIVSGDDSLPEVLGYSDSGDFDINNIPDNMKWWLSEYEQQIEALRQSGVQAASETVELHKAIQPLLTCQWNQDAPYYNSCPKFLTGTQSVTGCVATAMAQVLYHHRAKSVSTLQAEIPAYQCDTNWGSRVSVNSFAAGSLIDWGNMLDTYNNSATDNQKKAVADLMAYCGASVEMDYADSENGGSGANSTGIPEAFKKYFGYSETATIKYRDRFTADNWDRLIYRELMNGRPVIFGGQDTNGGGGHAFVCDGYAEDGKYHFNWGWGGLADGYYEITNLAPTDQGIGAGAGVYNDDVDVVIGMEPGDGTPYEEKIRVTVSNFSEPATQTYKYSENSTIPFSYNYSFQNRTTSTRTFYVALALYQDGKFKEILTGGGGYVSPKNLTWSPHGTMSTSGSGWKAKGIGTYQVKVVSRLNSTEDWQESADADKWYVDMIIEEDQISYVLHQYEEPEVVLGYDIEETVFVGAEGLATYCPAYGVKFSEDGKIAAYKASVDGNTVNLTRVYTVAAGEGVLLRSLSDGAVEETLPIDENVTENSDNAFVGTLIEIDDLGETDGTKTNFILSQKGDVIGFYKANDNTKVPAGKAYLPVANYQANGASLVIAFDDNTTGISDVTSEKIQDNAIYTLGGTRVKNPTKGIYIMNGKKIVIK